jgi:thiol-disulfide isomerase/thioredoxin
MLRSGVALPSLEGATEWVNGAIDPSSLTGRPTLVHFWALSCHICKDHFPALAAYRAHYGPLGLQIVSVHMPRQPSDTDVEAVKAAVHAHGMSQPVAIDNGHVIGDRFETGGMWPAYFLFDAGGRLRSRAAGASGLRLLESTLRHLLLAA